MNSVYKRLALLAVVIVAVTGATVQPSLTPSEQGVVQWWLGCFECDQARDSIRALGVRKPVASVDSLNAALVNGPPTARLIAVDSALAIAYVRDSTHEQRLNRRISTRAQYISENRERFVNGYRSRGALGLGWIHTPRAVAFLNAATSIALPPSVQSAVLYARDSLPN